MSQAWTSPLGRLARRLDVRIFTLSLVLLLLVQLACFTVIRNGIEQSAHRQIERELQTAEGLLRRLLAQNGEQLTAAARLLAADYGFREAVGSGDAATIRDALDNHSERIGATAALFTDLQQQVVASTLGLDMPALQQLVQANVLRGPAAPSQVLLLQGLPYQLVTVPVRAPQLIGHVSMGFPGTGRVGRELYDLTRVQTLFIVRRTGAADGWKALPTGTDNDALEALVPQLDMPSTRELVQGNDSFALHRVALARNDDHEVMAVLLRSRQEVMAPYRQLQWSLLGITLAGVVVFGAGSLLTTRRLTGSIQQLSACADRLGAGDYTTPVAVAGHDEVRDLASSFESMRQAMQQRDAEIRRLAYWDPLTGLPNRAQLRDLMGERLAQARRAGLPCAVLLLDIDRFKHVNDVLGQAVGDRLLREIGVRLAGSVLRENDVVARLSGDDFAVLLPQADSEAAQAVAHRLRQVLEQPLNLDDHMIDVSAGIGIAWYPAHGDDADVLLGRAELAMYAAKEQRSGVVVYDPALDSASTQSLSLLTELRQAVAQDELRLYLQPKIALASGRVVGAEALVRWQHPRRGLVPPMQFIPFAEQTGFIRELTGWMIERCAASSETLNTLQPAGAPLKFAVNLSTRDLLDHELPAKLERLLGRTSVRPELLCLEITESAIMDDPQRAMQTLARLHAMGLKLSIDDFGTGYSSLAYLKRLPLHELKIDRSFVMAMESDPADRKIVRSTVDLAHNLGLSVVAEGIENAATWDLLKDLQCDEGQGFHIAKPMPEEGFAKWMGEWRQQRATENGNAVLASTAG